MSRYDWDVPSKPHDSFAFGTYCRLVSSRAYSILSIVIPMAPKQGSDKPVIKKPNPGGFLGIHSAITEVGFIGGFFGGFAQKPGCLNPAPKKSVSTMALAAFFSRQE